MGGKRDWAEGEVGLLTQSKRSLTRPLCVLWSWDQSSEMSWMEVRGWAFQHPFPRSNPHPRLLFGRIFLLPLSSGHLLSLQVRREWHCSQFLSCVYVLSQLIYACSLTSCHLRPQGLRSHSATRVSWAGSTVALVMDVTGVWAVAGTANCASGLAQTPSLMHHFHLVPAHSLLRMPWPYSRTVHVSHFDSPTAACHKSTQHLSITDSSRTIGSAGLYSPVTGLLVPQPNPAPGPLTSLDLIKSCQPSMSSSKWFGAAFASVKCAVSRT